MPSVSPTSLWMFEPCFDVDVELGRDLARSPTPRILHRRSLTTLDFSVTASSGITLQSIVRAPTVNAVNGLKCGTTG